MTNTKVVETWVKVMLNNSIVPKKCSAANLHADGKYLVSYATPIAKYENGRFQISTKRYSVTTARQRSLVKYFVPVDLKDDILEINAPKKYFPWRW